MATTLRWHAIVSFTLTCICIGARANIPTDGAQLLHTFGAQPLSIPTETDVLFSKIKDAFEKQQALFKTMAFDISYVVPKQLPNLDPTTLLQINPLECISDPIVYRQAFHMNSSGHYCNTIQAHRLTSDKSTLSGTLVSKPASLPYGTSLNNAVFRSLTAAGKACIYPAADYPKDDTFNPARLMHHHFDRNLISLLEAREPCKINKKSDGTIEIIYATPEYAYHYTSDPRQHYMITHFQKFSICTDFPVPLYEHGIMYAQTEEGFAYPHRCFVKRFNQLVLLAQTTQFQHNPGLDDLALSFPLGITINNYTAHQNRPIQYRWRDASQNKKRISEAPMQIITGYVVDSNNHPIPNVPVVVHPRLPDEVRCLGSTFMGWHQQVWDGLTDDTGYFTIDISRCAWHVVCPADQHADPLDYTLVFTHDDFSAHIAHGIVIGDQGLQITLSQTTSVRGHVQTAEEGQYHPLPNTMVIAELVDRSPHNIRGLPSHFCAITDKGGRFIFRHPYTVSYHSYQLFDHPPRTREQLLRLQCQGSSELVTFNETSQNQWIMLTVDPQYSEDPLVTGVIHNGAGHPVAGASVQVCGTKQQGFYDSRLHQHSLWAQRPTTVTDAMGRFVLPVQDNTIYHLLVEKACYAPLVVRNVPTGKRHLRLSLGQEGTLSGRVSHTVNGRKLPLPNAQVRATQLHDNTQAAAFLSSDRITRTDARGRFYLDHLIANVVDNLTLSQGYLSPVHTWDILCQSSQSRVTFTHDNTVATLEMTVSPEVPKAYVSHAE